MDFLKVIDIVVLTQGLLLGTLILFNRPSKVRAYTFLGAHLILLSLSDVTSMLEERGLIAEIPWLEFLPLNFYFLFPLLLFLYAQEIAGVGEVKLTVKRFILGIIEIILLTGLMVGQLLGLWSAESLGVELIGSVYLIWGVIFMIRYLVKIIRLINKVKRDAENRYSSLEWKTLGWLRIACYLILFTFSFNFITLFLPESFELGVFWIESLINSTFTIWLAIHGFKQTVIISALELANGEKAHPLPHEVAKESKVIPLEGDKKLYEEVVALVLNKSLYKKQELTLADLAKEAGIHQKQLSFLINHFSGKNFFNFINEYRVKEAQQLLMDKKYEHLSFLGIAFEAGFNSKATFNASFKKVTGQTPRQYKTSRQSA